MTFSQLLLDPVSVIELIALGLAATTLFRSNMQLSSQVSSRVSSQGGCSGNASADPLGCDAKSSEWIRPFIGVGKVLRGSDLFRCASHVNSFGASSFGAGSFSSRSLLSRSLVGVGVLISEPKRSLERQRF